MKSLFFLISLLMAFVLKPSTARAQESNYSNYEVGSMATMLGGSVTAGIANISAIYYNPGALSFLETTSVSLETAALFGGSLKIENGAGQDIDIKSSFFDVIPSLIGGTFKGKKNKDLTFAYAAITVNSSLINFNVRNTAFIDVLTANSGDELYEGIYDYSNKIRENWIGASVSKKVNKNFAFGATLFGAYFSQAYSLRQSAIVSNVLADTISTSLASSSFQRDLRFSSFGLILKAGAVYRFDYSSIGLTMTTPNLNIDLFAKGGLSEIINVNIPGVIPTFSTSLYGEKLTTYHRTPFIISLGYQKELVGAKWNLSLTYNSAVKEYTMVETAAQFIGQPGLRKPPLRVFDMARQIFNVAFGLKKDLREGLSFLGGARTDLNYISSEFLESNRFIPKMSYWNLYHITTGIIWFTEKAHLTLGGDYAFGASKGDLQQVNLSDPEETNLLFGTKTTNTKTSHNQINLVLGFSYSF